MSFSIQFHFKTKDFVQFYITYVVNKILYTIYNAKKSLFLNPFMYSYMYKWSKEMYTFADLRKIVWKKRKRKNKLYKDRATQNSLLRIKRWCDYCGFFEEERKMQILIRLRRERSIEAIKMCSGCIVSQSFTKLYTCQRSGINIRRKYHGPLY